MDCEWGEWIIGDCSQACGVGSRNNTRDKTVVEIIGGICNGSSSATEECNPQDCPGNFKIIVRFVQVNNHWILCNNTIDNQFV